VILLIVSGFESVDSFIVKQEIYVSLK